MSLLSTNLLARSLYYFFNCRVLSGRVTTGHTPGTRATRAGYWAASFLMREIFTNANASSVDLQ